MQVDWPVTIVVSALVSGVIGLCFGRLRDRRLAKHIDRKEHFQRIRVEVLERMLEKLEGYRRAIDRNVGGWEFPVELKLSLPTNSRLFETLHLHFPKVTIEWDSFERKMEFFGEETIVFCHSIESTIQTKHDAHFQYLRRLKNEISDEDVCIRFYGALVHPKKENPEDVITLKPHEGKWLIDLPRTNLITEDTESLEAVKQIRATLKSLAEDPDLRRQASRIAQNHTALLQDGKKLEGTIRDAIARSRLEGKCRYCP